MAGDVSASATVRCGVGCLLSRSVDPLGEVLRAAGCCMLRIAGPQLTGRALLPPPPPPLVSSGLPAAEPAGALPSPPSAAGGSSGASAGAGLFSGSGAEGACCTRTAKPCGRLGSEPEQRWVSFCGGVDMPSGSLTVSCTAAASCP